MAVRILAGVGCPLMTEMEQSVEQEEDRGRGRVRRSSPSLPLLGCHITPEIRGGEIGKPESEAVSPACWEHWLSGVCPRTPTGFVV